jgi:hypothetical protein
MIAALAATLPLLSVPCRADGLGPGDFFHDLGQYVTSPLRWDEEDWMYFGGTLAAIGAAHALDTQVRDHFAGNSPSQINGGQDPNSKRDILPAAALLGGTWLVSEITGNEFGKGESYSMIESSLFSAMTLEAMKYAGGRERPNQTLNDNAWRDGGASFPSMHTGVAFAIGTVFAESGDDDYRWLRRFIGYGTASAVMYLRLHGNEHWFSDTVAGAAVGMATAHFSINRRLERIEALQNVSFSVVPEPGGAKLTFAMLVDN